MDDFQCKKTLAGMAHGNSGFLMLYAALYQITGNKEYLKKINLLCEYENSLYSEEKENWLDLRAPENEKKVMNAWCHGAPGVLLARLQIEKIKEYQGIEEDVKRASYSLFYGKEDGKICICHGLAGRLLIMKKYLEQHKQSEFREIYNQKVQELILMLEQKDDLNVSETRNPAFMNGISGVVYALLKIYTEMK
ncbi:lanthionine synthetase LanC family protein [Blautia sp. XA-2221]|uniref:lanthionine synthetase LanC family protein n=1 Tax=Blautia sp. XA-2221 TaxID=2903961 RepID=UPI002378F8B2|nr:lanthionine synthetase LanC family protein [Blautia sp. XA-2221]